MTCFVQEKVWLAVFVELIRDVWTLRYKLKKKLKNFAYALKFSNYA